MWLNLLSWGGCSIAEAAAVWGFDVQYCLRAVIDTIGLLYYVTSVLIMITKTNFCHTTSFVWTCRWHGELFKLLNIWKENFPSWKQADSNQKPEDEKEGPRMNVNMIPEADLN